MNSAPGEEYVELETSNEEGNITVNVSGEAKWVIDVRGFPMPYEFHWFSPKKQDLISANNMKYSITYQLDQNNIILTVHSVTMQDAGVYEFSAANSDKSASIFLVLTVLGKDKCIQLFKMNKLYML